MGMRRWRAAWTSAASPAGGRRRWANSRRSGQGRRDIEGSIVNGGEAEIASHFQGGAAKFLVLVFEGDLVDAVLVGFAGAAKADRRAGQRLQLQSDVLENVRLPGAAAKPLEETAARADATAVLDQRRKPGHQTLVEARQFIGRGIF